MCGVRSHSIATEASLAPKAPTTMQKISPASPAYTPLDGTRAAMCVLCSLGLGILVCRIFGTRKFVAGKQEWSSRVYIKDARVHVYFLWKFELSSCVPTISSYARLSIMAVTRPFPSRLNPLCSTIISTVLHYPPDFSARKPPSLVVSCGPTSFGSCSRTQPSVFFLFSPAVWRPPLERLARAVWLDWWLYGGNSMLRLFWDCGCAQSL